MNRIQKAAQRPDLLILVILLGVIFGILADGAIARQEAVDKLIDEQNQITQDNHQAGVEEPATLLPQPLSEKPVATSIIDDYNPNVPLTPEEQRSLLGACREFRISPDIALGLIEKETDFRNMAGDGGESQGYMQVQRKWWHHLMEDIGATDLTVPEDNFRTGCAILRTLIDKYHGDVSAALTAYNVGYDNGSRKYANAVLANSDHWRI